VTEVWGRHSDHETLGEKVTGRLRDIGRVRATLSRQPFDVMVVKTSHEWWTLGRDIPLLFATRPLCRHIVVQFHGGRSDLLAGRGHTAFKIASQMLLRASDGALTLSTDEQRHLQQFYPQGRFYRVSNPFLAPDRVRPVADVRSFGLKPGVPTLLFVGRLMREKGIFDTLDALAMLKHRIAYQLLVVGDGSETDAVRERIRALGLEHTVVLTGYLGRDAVADAYSTADCFVLPTYWFEGFPTVIAEAMHAGLPIVTTRTRGIADHLDDELNALFVPPRDTVALAAALERVLADHSLRASMGRANREKVSELSPAVVGRHYLQTLREIVGHDESAMVRNAPHQSVGR